MLDPVSANLMPVAGNLQEAMAVLATALGCGLLIGIERERRKGSGPGRALAGLRTFAITSVTGAVAALTQVPGLVVTGALMVAALAVMAYLRDRSDDPGTTTEIALFLTYLIGVLCVWSLPLSAALAVGLTALLAGREPLHRFAQHWLRQGEVRDGIILAALVLMALPLVPNRPFWGPVLNPYVIVQLLALVAGGAVAGPPVPAPAAGARSGGVFGAGVRLCLQHRHHRHPGAGGPGRAFQPPADGRRGADVLCVDPGADAAGGAGGAARLVVGAVAAGPGGRGRGCGLGLVAGARGAARAGRRACEQPAHRGAARNRERPHVQPVGCRGRGRLAGGHTGGGPWAGPVAGPDRTAGGHAGGFSGRPARGPGRGLCLFGSGAGPRARSGR